MKEITGNVRSIGGCSVAKTLSIDIETSNNIKIEDIIGKDVKVVFEDKSIDNYSDEELKEYFFAFANEMQSRGFDIVLNH